MRHLIKNTVARRAVQVLVALIMLLILLPFALYIPWVQSVVKDYACDYVSKTTGLDVEIDRVLLKFPLDLSVDRLVVLDQKRDTMVRVQNFTAGVEAMPLVHLDFKIGDAQLTQAYCRMVNADSSMYLVADVDKAKLSGTDLNLKKHELNLLDGELDGGRIVYTAYPYREKPDTAQADTTAGQLWRVNALKLTLRNIDYTMRSLPTIDKMHAHIGYGRLLNGVVDMEKHTVDVKNFMIDSVTCRYRMLSERDIELYEQLHPTPLDTTKSAPWIVNLDKVLIKHINYNMAMLPVIDNLNARIGSFELNGGAVNMTDNTIRARSIKADSVDCAYYMPGVTIARSSARLHPAVAMPDDSNAVPWTIRCDTIGMTHAHAIYATTGHKPQRGFDPEYIEVHDVNVAVNGFYNSGSNIEVPITGMTARERCGIEIKKADGTFAMSNDEIDLKNFNVKTMLSQLSLNAHAPLTLLNDKPKGHFKIVAGAQVALQEIGMVVPALKATLSQIPQYHPISVNVNASGSPSRLSIGSFTAHLPNYAHASMNGRVSNPLDVKQMRGDIAFDAKFDNINFIKPTLLDKAQRKQINFPPMALNGRAQFGANSYSGNVSMKLAQGGQMVGKGSFSGNSKRYLVDATFTGFPVKAVLPLAPVDRLTAHVKVGGHGFDFMKTSTTVNADLNLGSVVYNGQIFENIQAQVNMNGGKVNGSIISHNKDCDLDLVADGRIEGDRYIFNVDGIVNEFDAKKFGFTDVACMGRGQLSAYVDYNTKTQHCNLDAGIDRINWNYAGTDIVSEATDLKFSSTAKQVTAYINNEDTHLDFVAQCSLNDFMKQLETASGVARRQLLSRNLDINLLQQALPKFTLNVKSGPNGVVPRYLGKYDIDFRDLNLIVENDTSIYMDGYVHGLSVDDRAVDTITVHSSEQESKYLGFKVHMGNRSGTWDEFAQVDIEGGAIGSTVGFMLTQHNIKGEVGYRFGANATLADQLIQTTILPKNPIVGYRQWEINDSNYVDFNYVTRMLDANLLIKNDDGSLALRTEAADEPGKENILLDVDNMKLEQWISAFPAMPVVAGTANGNIKLLYDGKNFDGNGVVTIKDFSYDHQNVGDVALNTSLAVDPATMSTKLDASMLLDGAGVAIAYGTLNDSTATNPFNVSMKLNRFPLQKASPFIPGNMILLHGYLNGELTLTGSSEKPLINGYVQGDSASVEMPLYGTSLRLSDDKINIDKSLIKMSGYKILSLNDNPVVVNGNVNLNTMDMMLSLKGRSVQFIGAKQKRWSEVFGKGLIDLGATIKSRAGLTTVDADVDLLTGSNLTYVMQDEVEAYASRAADEHMVTFINPTDSTSVLDSLKTVAGTSALDINLDLGIAQGAKLNIYLSPDGKDRASVDGNGHLRYTMDFAGKTGLVGAYTVENGNVRYSPPIISQKNFDINSGSKITWTGELLNPQLNITGVDDIKTGVTGSDGTSRLVDFVVTAKLRNSLSNIDLSFDMSADNDMAVQNELQSMTAEQRSNAAINLLLYNTYSGLNASNINLTTTGALYSFLQSQLNSWAASTLKGVDLTFGINHYDNSANGANSTATSYSYRLSKTLFNDRFKIVVGGEYSTAASSEQNFSNNLINDISFEYNLNASGSRYVRLFRHTGWESVLEGEVTELGVGYVMKRKLSSLKHLFKFKSPETVMREKAEREAKEAVEARKEEETDSTLTEPTKKGEQQ